MIRFCPDLTGKEEVKAILRGHGDFTRPILNACIKERCVAYKKGMCMKYDNWLNCWRWKNKNGNI